MCVSEIGFYVSKLDYTLMLRAGRFALKKLGYWRYLQTLIETGKPKEKTGKLLRDQDTIFPRPSTIRDDKGATKDGIENFIPDHAAHILQIFYDIGFRKQKLRLVF